MKKSSHAKQRIDFYSPGSTPYHSSYGCWTVKWWQWALGTPQHINPVLDGTGIHADKEQTGDTWYLAGKFGSEDRNLPSRRCSIPVGKAILFPILNCAATRVEYPNLKTDEDLINHVSRDVDSVITKHCSINGVMIPAQRVKSDPQIFDIFIPKDAPLGLRPSGVTRAAADGYWVFLKPLPSGEYCIDLEGSCENGRLYSGAKYDITIS